MSSYGLVEGLNARRKQREANRMPNEIVPDRSNALMLEPDSIIPTGDNTVKVLRLSHHDKKHDYMKMLAAAVQLFSAVDIIGKIQKGAEFIVQVPAQYQAELQAGVLEMMHGSKSGKTWATLVRKLADGKQEIVCNCPITEQMRVQGNPTMTLPLLPKGRSRNGAGWAECCSTPRFAAHLPNGALCRMKLSPCLKLFATERGHSA